MLHIHIYWFLTSKCLDVCAHESRYTSTDQFSCRPQVNQIDMASNNIVRTWESIAAAARNLNISLSELNGALSNRTDSAGGFKWEYVLAASGMGTAEKSGEEDEDDDFEDEVSFSIVCIVCVRQCPVCRCGAGIFSMSNNIYCA